MAGEVGYITGAEARVEIFKDGEALGELNVTDCSWEPEDTIENEGFLGSTDVQTIQKFGGFSGSFEYNTEDTNKIEEWYLEMRMAYKDRNAAPPEIMLVIAVASRDGSTPGTFVFTGVKFSPRKSGSGKDEAWKSRVEWKSSEMEEM